ncbi:MAG: glycosyltransferase family 61 protein [Bacteroidales bacterium]|nr:glycosyltransferase family 61 protein [Bacteroidales bacterium]
MLQQLYNKIKNWYDKQHIFSFLDSETEKLYFANMPTSPVCDDISSLSENAKTIFNHLTTDLNPKYLFHYTKKAFFEPEWLCGLTDDGKIISASVPNNDWQWKGYWPMHPLPSAFNIKYRYKKHLYFDKIIVVDDFYGFSNNYYHFLVHLIGQLLMLQEKGIDMSLPVLMPRSIREKRFFVEFADKYPLLKQLNYIEYDRCIVHCNEFYICNSTIITENQIQLFKQITTNSNIHNKKIFIGRKNVARVASNANEIEKIMKSFGFETVYFENHTLDEQIAIIRDADYFVSYHGAGLTNLLFTNNPNLKVLEIHNSNAKLYWHYALFCAKMKINYDCFVGGEMKNDSYYVNPLEFEKKISEWIAD